jgi:hypothetical protein
VESRDCGGRKDSQPIPPAHTDDTFLQLLDSMK